MKEKRTSIIPIMRYKNARTAIAWLCRTFGFEEHLVIAGNNNSIEHAQLILGECMIMLGSIKNDSYGKYFKTPGDIDGMNTQAPYIIIDKIDEHYQKVVSEKTEILIPLKEEDYGGKSYTCKDPEGHIWSFGSYNPWRDTKP